MANIINNQDPQGHISSAAKMGSIDNLAKLFRNRYGAFSDAEGENIVIFAKNADTFMTQNMIPSLEMGTIILRNLKKEPLIRAKRWRDTMTVDPEKINADHWREQPYQAATPFMPFQPMQMAQVMIPARPAGIDIHGNPDPDDPGHPGQPQLPFIEMRPPIQAVREQVAVDRDYCLRAYLLRAFQKKVDITAAEKFLATFKRQQPKQTCSNFIDVFMVKFEHYITLRWTVDEREAPNFRENINTTRLQYIREGLCREFKKHLDSNPQIVTLQQVDDEVQRWARETIEGQEFTRNRSKTHHPLITEQLDSRNTQDEDSPDSTGSYSPTSTGQKSRNTTIRTRGCGARKENTFSDHRRPELPEIPRDMNAGNDYYQPNHNGRSQLLFSAFKTIGETFVRLGTWITQRFTSEYQQTQWSTTQHNAQTPVAFTVTDPGDAEWMARIRNSGSDPATVVTTYPRKQQHPNRSERRTYTENNNTSTAPPTDGTYQEGAHREPPDGPDNNNYHSLILPSGILVCTECEYLTTSVEAADRHQEEKHPYRDQTSHVQPPKGAYNLQPSGSMTCNDYEHTTTTSASLLPSGFVACNNCGQVFPSFESIDKHFQEAHPKLANKPERRN